MAKKSLLSSEVSEINEVSPQLISERATTEGLQKPILRKKPYSEAGQDGRRRKIDGRIRTRVGVSFVSLIIVAGAVLPSSVHAASIRDFVSQGASVMSAFVSGMKSERKTIVETDTPNLQTLLLPKAAMNIDPNPAKGGGDITIADGEAVVAEEGPSGTIADIVKSKSQSISIYVVQEGNTLSEIAKMFDVSVNTIKWANDIPPNGTIRVGQTLTILPVTGVKYIVKKGDTIASIAKAYRGDADEIANFNGIDSASLAVGDEIIIPDGELAAAPRVASSKASASSANSAQYAGYYLRPIVGGIRSQGVHGYNGVDLAAPAGTPILASATGDVIVAKGTGWNGGYGEYLVIRHDNGTQTLYAHASSIIVGVGQHVVRGQVIGYVGSTGRSTGAHVHFEIRGGPRNPF